DVTVDTLVPSWAGTSISGLTAETATLHMGMNHQTIDIAAATLSACGSCHENAGSGEYYPGLLHSSLANSVPVIAQPTLCMDCHFTSRPNAVLTSANSAMPPNLKFDHGAGAALGDCASCHTGGSATQWTSWSQGRFHLVGSATPATCLPCHAPERPTTTAG